MKLKSEGNEGDIRPINSGAFAERVECGKIEDFI
jgi:hypothetical protein